MHQTKLNTATEVQAQHIKYTHSSTELLNYYHI